MKVPIAVPFFWLKLRVWEQCSLDAIVPTDTNGVKIDVYYLTSKNYI